MEELTRKFAEDFFAKRVTYDARFRLKADEFKELEKASIVIQDRGDEISVGVKARCFVPKADENKQLSVKEEAFGGFVMIGKECSIAVMFDAIKTLIEQTMIEIEHAKKGEQA